MSLVRDQHRRAMELTDQALAARRIGDQSSALALFRQALECERQAAELVAADGAVEPTRSVLFRSAATLALDCAEVREAERLIALGLSGDPPPEIAEELRDLLEQVHFQRHLQLRGISLEPTEFQVSIAGGAVGPGIAPSAAFVDRVESIQKLLHRTAERARGLHFRERGPSRKSLQDEFDLFISVPRAASFAVTFRLGRPTSQLGLPGTEDTGDVVQELLRCLELFGDGKVDELRQRINNDAYYRNFVALARQIAPDGVQVRLVGFTSRRDGEEQQVALGRPADLPAFTQELPVHDKLGERVSVTGELQYADALRGPVGTIKVVDRQGNQHRVTVPEGMMADIVKPLWEEVVTVTGRKARTRIILEDIKRASEL